MATTYTEQEITQAVNEVSHQYEVPERLEYNRQLEQSKYVTVVFTPGGREYGYRCPDCKRGDWVVVPPSSVCAEPQVLQVRHMGLPIAGQQHRTSPRTAHKVPRDIALGTEYGDMCSGGYETGI